jgi:hypothetical protein
MTSDDLQRMKLHQIENVHESIRVMRVVNGWVYLTMDLENVVVFDLYTTMVFVPEYTPLNNCVEEK